MNFLDCYLKEVKNIGRNIIIAIMKSIVTKSPLKENVINLYSLYEEKVIH